MNPATEVEWVLCAQARDLPSVWLPPEGALPLEESDFFLKISSIPAHWLPRPVAESNEDYKQWITYGIVEDSDGLLAVYPRQGSDARLHGRWSLGIGGHVNPTDSPKEFHARECLLAGFRRELQEEFPEATEGTTTFKGVIYESHTHVGRVHLGVVFHHRIPRSAPSSTGDLSSLTWIHRSDLGRDPWRWARIEGWSKLALQLCDAPPDSKRNL